MSQQNPLTLLSATKSFGGWIKRFKHTSSSLNCEMIFALYLPPQAEQQSVPLMWWLSGLTCNDENFMQKAGAQRLAAELGIAIICPDTSPRGVNLPGEDDSYDFGSGAGFYLNATREPWSKHYHMYDYIAQELPELVHAHFPLNGKQAISGHPMGGHGALVMALRNPERYTSVSAFAPIVNATNCPWGQKAFTGYLGDNRDLWAQYDTCELVASNVSKQPLFLQKIVTFPLINKQRLLGYVAGNEFASIVLRPQIAVIAQIAGKGFLAPRSEERRVGNEDRCR